MAAAARQAQGAGQVPAASILGRVAAATNGGVQLTRLQGEGDGKVTVEGRARNSRSLQLLGLMLGQGQAVRLPIIESLREEESGALNFRISASFPKTAAPPPKPAGGTP